MPNLAALLKTRFLQKRPFSEQEMVTLLKSVLYGLSYLEYRGIPFGDVHPTNIFYDQLNDLYKIGNPIYNYDPVVMTRQALRFCFLAPEKARMVLEPGFTLTLDQEFKSDVFSLGMMMLEIAVMERAEACYFPDHSVNLEEVNRRIQACEARYGRQLATGLVYCL
jgi:serine/threonine protein kinase